jgi:type I restriction enzyme S subunit
MSKAWPLVPLGEILTPVTRSEDVGPEVTYRILGAHWYAEGLYTKEVKPGSQIQAAKVYRVEEGDFVYNRLFAWKGSFAVATKENHECYVSNEFPCFVINQDVADGQYLWRYFSRAAVWEEALGLSSGGTPTSRNRLKEEKLLAMKIPLPPLPEQQRIVTRIEELAAKIEEARELRRLAVEEAEVFVQAFLNGEHASNIARFGETKLDKVCLTVTDGDHQTPTFVDAGVKFIFVGNVSSGLLHFSGCKYVTPEYYASIKPHRKPQVGDILYSAVGATLGIPAIVNCTEDFCFQRHVALIKPDRNRLVPEFLWYMLRSGTLYKKAWAATTGSAQPTVPLRAIRALPIPIPPLSEQRRIVAYLDDLQAKVDTLKRLQAETAAELDALLPSVLDKAFKGEL